MVRKVIACLFAAIFLSAGLGATEYSYPVFTASYGKAPAIDGKINEAEWSDASSYSGFMNTCPLGEELRSLPLHFLVPTQTKLWLKWDDKKLYMAFQCERIQGVDITATISAGERDKNLTKEDSMEFFFIPAKGGANGGRNFFFLGNSKGAVFDGINKDEDFKQWNGGWNGDWTYAASVDEKYWSGELSIPFASLLNGTPENNQAWKFGAGRYQPGFLRSSLNPTGGYFFNDQYYGSIIFSRDWEVNSAFPKSKLRTCLKTSVKNISGSEKSISFAGNIYEQCEKSDYSIRFPHVAKGFALENITFFCDPSKGKKIEKTVKLAPGASEEFLILLPAENNSKLMAEELCKADGSLVIYSQTAPMLYQEEAPINASLNKYFLSKKEVNAVVKGYSIASTKILMALLDAKGKSLDSKEFDKKGAQDVVWTIKTDTLTPGNYTVKITDGGNSKNMALKIPEEPVWHKEKTGVFTQIPPPFKPIGTEGNWMNFSFGQGLMYEQSPLPSQVRTVFGNEILAAPVSLQAEIDGKPVTLKTENCKTEKISGGLLKITCDLIGGGLKARAETKVEFDGFAWTTLEILSCRGKISKLSLVVPLKKEAAELFKMTKADIHTGAKFFRGKVEENTTDYEFMPSCWLGGMEKGGLEWSCESYRYWNNANPLKRIKIIPEKDKTLVSFNFIDKETTLNSPVEYSFGFLPTPVRDPRKYNFWKDTKMFYTDQMRDLKSFDRKTNDRSNFNFWFLDGAPKQFSKGLVAAYPLKDNINGNEGSIEVCFKPQVESPQQWLDIFYVETGDKQGLKLDISNDDKNWKDGKATIRLSAFGDKNESLQSKIAELQMNSFHQVAVSWEKSGNGTHFEIWLDGKKIAEKDFSFNIAKTDWLNKRFFLGGNTQMLFDNLKISATATPSATMGKTPSPANALLVDLFDDSFMPNDYRQTRAAKISGSSAETGGWIDAYGEFVEGGVSGNALKLSVNNSKSDIELAKAAGMEIAHSHYWHRDTFSTWWTAQNPEREKVAKEFINALHQNGLKSSVYYLKNISPDDPNWNEFGAEMILRPMRASINNYIICPKSGSGADFLTWTVKKMIDNYGIDNLHMDYGDTFPCNGVEHGCGWVDESGNTHKSWPILAHREMHRRMYNLFHISPLQNGFYRNHVSDGPIIAADGVFTDYWVTGEVELATPKKGGLGEWMPESEYLAFYSYYNTGMPCYGGIIQPWSMMAFDGMPIMQPYLAKTYALFDKKGMYRPYEGGGDMKLRLKAHLFVPAFIDFADGELIGFWKTSQYLKFSPDDEYVKKFIRASILRDAKNKRCLVIVGNPGSKKQDVQMKLDLAKLGFNPEKTAAYDVFTREVYPNASELSFPVGEENIRMIILREKP